MTKGIKAKIDSFAPSELPELIMPHIELCADKRGIVEGCKGILSFSNEKIGLNCKTHTVLFTGENLSLCELCDGKITVTGKISCVSISK